MVKSACRALLVGLAVVVACEPAPQSVAPDAVSGPPPARAARPATGSAGPTASERAAPAAPAPRPPGLPSRTVGPDLETSPARAVYEDAERLRAMGRVEEAKGLYQQAVTIDPEHHLAWYALFDLVRRGDDPDLSADTCAGLLASRTFSGHEAASRNLQCALAHRDAGRLDQAEVYARDSVATGGDRLEPLVTLSAILLDQNQSEAVIELFEGRLRETGGSHEASAYSNLGTAYLRLGRFEEAVTAYQMAERLDVDRIDVLINLSDALRQAGRVEEADQAFERARTIDPEHPAVQSRLP